MRAILTLVLALLAWPDNGFAQTKLAQPASWCRTWTDNCTSCGRPRDGSEITCSQVRGTRPDCKSGRVRCTVADFRELKEACATPRTIWQSCNACGPLRPDGGRMCTAKACPVQEIVCVTPR